MRHLATLAAGLSIAIVAPHGKAQVNTIVFDNVAGVPSSHHPQAGGYLHPDSQNFQEAGMHIEIFWVPNNGSSFIQGHFHHVENNYETSHGFETGSGFGPDRQGLYIRRLDGAKFDLLGHRYRNNHGVVNTMYVTGVFDPAVAGYGQFTPVGIGPGTLWQEVELDQFQDLDELFLLTDLGTSPSHHFSWDDIRVGEVAGLIVDAIDGSSLNGGTGWSGEGWETVGNVAIGGTNLSGGAPRTALRIKNTGSIRRTAPISGVLNPRMTIDIKIANYAGSDTATLQVSGDGVNFTTLREFDAADSDNQFYEYEFNLNVLGGASSIEVALVTNTTGSPKYCFVDNLVIKGVDAGGAAPIADAGADSTVVDSSGSVDVDLDGSSSFDSDGTIVSYEWTEGAVLLGTTQMLTVNMAYGQHVVTLSIEDNDGNFATDEVVIYCSPGSIATDGFESGDLSGGAGDWTGSWVATGLFAVGPVASRPSLISRIRDAGSLTRTVDLTAATSARLTCWYMVADYELSDTAYIEVSSDGVNFTTIQTITDAVSDRVWRFLDLDLSSFDMTSNFVIRLRSDTQTTNARDYIHIDDVAVVGIKP